MKSDTVLRSLILSLSLFSGISLAQPTQIKIFNAFTKLGGLDPNLIIIQRTGGKCWTSSLADISRSDAWRCQTDNLILDPCFHSDGVVACLISPWTKKVTLLELTTPLPPPVQRQLNTQTGQPWALELSNGQQCVFLTGASSVFHNSRINYACSLETSVIGDIDRSGPTWKVSLCNIRKKTVSTIAVTTAWF